MGDFKTHIAKGNFFLISFGHPQLKVLDGQEFSGMDCLVKGKKTHAS